MNGKLVVIGTVLVIVGLLLLFLYIPLTSVSSAQISNIYDPSTGNYKYYGINSIISIYGTVTSIKYLPLINSTLITLDNNNGAWLLSVGNITDKVQVGNSIVASSTLVPLPLGERIVLDLLLKTPLKNAWTTNAQNIQFQSIYNMVFFLFILAGIVVMAMSLFERK